MLEAKVRKGQKHETLDKVFRSTVCSASRAGQLTNAIVDLVALDMRPVSIVTGTGFRRLLNVCEPGYRVLSTTHISSLLQKKYAEGKARVVKVLASVDGISLTTNMCTSRSQQGYITVMCHFLDVAWALQTLPLTTTGFAEHRTAENIGARLVKICNSAEITPKVVGIMHDEAANQCAAIRSARKTSRNKKAAIFGPTSWESTVCSADRLQTCLQHAFDEEASLIRDSCTKTCWTLSV